MNEIHIPIDDKLLAKVNNRINHLLLELQDNKELIVSMKKIIAQHEGIRSSNVSLGEKLRRSYQNEGILRDRLSYIKHETLLEHMIRVVKCALSSKHRELEVMRGES